MSYLFVHIYTFIVTVMQLFRVYVKDFAALFLCCCWIEVFGEHYATLLQKNRGEGRLEDYSTSVP